MTARRRARWVRADYPSKRGLSKPEAMRVLSNGPDAKWFEPWAKHALLFPGLTQRSYGYIHVRGSQESLHCDVATWDSREGLNWGLEALYKRHSGCTECQGVLYFAPVEPLRLRLVVEVDDLGDEEADQ